MEIKDTAQGFIFFCRLYPEKKCLVAIHVPVEAAGKQTNGHDTRSTFR